MAAPIPSANWLECFRFVCSSVYFHCANTFRNLFEAPKWIKQPKRQHFPLECSVNLGPKRYVWHVQKIKSWKSINFLQCKPTHFASSLPFFSFWKKNVDYNNKIEINKWNGLRFSDRTNCCCGFKTNVSKHKQHFILKCVF